MEAADTQSKKIHGQKMHTLNNTTGSQDPIDPNPNLDPDQFPHRNHNHPQSRRPRGFAATAAASIAPAESDVNNGNIAGIGGGETTSGGGGKGKREREKEKERTKLRERHRRAITSRMLAGLRQYGNFPLPARADMNDVIAALAREAGWSVDADGTTYRQSQQPNHVVEPFLSKFKLFKSLHLKCDDSFSILTSFMETKLERSIPITLIEYCLVVVA